MLLSKRLREAIKSLGPLARDFQVLVAEAERLERELNLRQRRITALNTVNQLAPLIALIKEQEDVNIMLRRILKAAIELSRATRGLVVLRDSHSEDGFRIYAAIGMETDASTEDAKLSRTLIKQILQRGEGIVTTNIQQDDRFEPGASLLATNIRSVMTTPIKLEGEVIGAIYVDSELAMNLFNEEDLEVFSAFASHAAVTLNLATSLQEKRDLHLQSILALVHAVEAADAYTAGHSRNVGYYAKGIAEELSMADKDVELLLIAGYLHDVGKIAVPNSVTKPGQLTDEEWQAMRMHPIYGERILRNSPALKDILPAVRWHHERWDGKGYPDGLREEQIHPYARIIAVADSFDAMTTDRPYRKAYSVDYALKDVEANIGKMYEKEAAEAFLRAFAKGRLQLAERSNADAALADLLGETEMMRS
ncbi:MAG: HD domain-containing protein [Deinococcales bacterium]